MNVVIPIHVSALRVSPSTIQAGKTALYDFAALGRTPLSSGGNLLAADRFAEAERALGREPGIHLHWSMPRAYTRGLQDNANGDLEFPSLPNRWLVTRFFENLATGAASTALWIIEADAHAADAQALDAATTTLPWMDSAADTFGLGFHYVGSRIALTGTWSEPSASPAGVAYLGPMLQATTGYGETFTAYYPHGRNLFGMYDDLGDLFAASNALEANCRFSVSYSVVGWVADSADDIVHAALSAAAAGYEASHDSDRPPFATMVERVLVDQLKLSLPDYLPLTLDEAGHAQGVLSGMASAIEWDIATPADTTYPTPLPSAEGVTVAVGNNNAEALSAHLSAAEHDASTDDPGDLTTNLEWLLNALQSGALPDLGDGELGVGQLDELLHTRSFAALAGGTLWTVRTLGSQSANAIGEEGSDGALSLPAARLLSQLNAVQHDYDALSDERFARQQKLFFDWCYHIDAIETNVVEGSGELGDDTSRDYLLDGLMHLFEVLARCGELEPGTASGPPVLKAASFRISAPEAQIPQLAEYVFDAGANGAASEVIGTLLAMSCSLEGALPAELAQLKARLGDARSALEAALAGRSTAPSYVQHALADVRGGLVLATGLQARWADLQGLATLKSAHIDPAGAGLSVFTDATNGLIASSLAVESDSTVPVAPGETYAGRVASGAVFVNAASWDARGDFPGIEDLLNRLTGQGTYQASVIDTRIAAIHLASAYFWRLSGDTATRSTPYYLQMALTSVTDAATDAATASDALATALAAIASDATLLDLERSLTAIATTALPGLLAELSASAPDVAGALTTLDGLLADARSGDTPSLASLLGGLRSPSWTGLLAAIERAWRAIVGRLPLAEQTVLLATGLDSQLAACSELGRAPAEPFRQPAEPVVLFAQPGSDALISPVDRNGRAAVLPCRLPSELVTASGAVTFPDEVEDLATRIDPGISGLAALVAQLVEEAWLLSPETDTVVSAAVLRSAAAANAALHFDAFDQVILQAAPAGLAGLLPYATAWSWWQGSDPYLPLFIYWQADYVYSQGFDSATGRLPPDYLAGFVLGQHETEYQPQPGEMARYDKLPAPSNCFGLSGVATLTARSADGLCDEIRAFCVATLDYDPAGGPPPAGAHHAEEQLLYQAYADFKTRTVLSQGLSGFNAGLLQRAQELQLPINIPPLWVDPDAKNLPRAEFWPTAFLHDQATAWPSNWSSQALDPDAFAVGDSAVHFNPVRAGFLQLRTLTLVDAFGRSVEMPDPNPQAVAESLQGREVIAPTDHPVYLPPRLAQPARLLARWISADSPDGLGEFTDWNPHPAASPICGWLLPDHLDSSLSLYDAGGAALGSLRQLGTALRWLTVPGESFPAGTDNRTLMAGDLEQRHANATMREFLETFAYPDESTGTAAGFDSFLAVLDESRQNILTKSMQEDQALAVLIGAPLVLARASLRMQLKGSPFVSLDARTYPPWNGEGHQFQMDGSGFIPYDLRNFNDAGIGSLRVPIRIGAVEFRRNGLDVPFFDDGVVGFFLDDDYTTFFTPVETSGGVRIRSTAPVDVDPAVVTVDGDTITVTLLLDPRATAHLSTGLLPVSELRLAPELYAAALDRLQMTFLVAPVLGDPAASDLAVPQEPGYDWTWWSVGSERDEPVRAAQLNTDVRFSSTRQRIVDGWLKLKKGS